MAVQDIRGLGRQYAVGAVSRAQSGVAVAVEQVDQGTYAEPDGEMIQVASGRSFIRKMANATPSNGKTGENGTLYGRGMSDGSGAG